MHHAQEFKKKKKSNKNIPVDELGFKAKIMWDVIDPRDTKTRTKHHTKNKNKSYAYETKENFIQKQKIIVDVHDLPPQIKSQQFKLLKQSDWQYVKKVIYRSPEKLFCSICLEEKFIAPQITYCGHLFCFHCILTHFQKSVTNSKHCPVCKEFTQQSELRTCLPLQENNPSEGQKITMQLRIKKGNRIYNYATFEEDDNCCHVIRMRSKGILPIFQQEMSEVMKELSITKQTERNHLFLNRAVEIISQRIAKTKQIIEKFPSHVKLEEDEKIRNETIYKSLTPKEDIQYFYQEESGSQIYLHSITSKYLFQCFNVGALPNLQIPIRQKQKTQISHIVKNHKELSHLSPHQEVFLVLLDLKGILAGDELDEHERQYRAYRSYKDKIYKEQEELAKKLNQEYEKEQTMIRSLKKLQQAEYSDINVPNIMDPSEMNEFTFPSLITSKSDSPATLKEHMKDHQQEPKLKEQPKIKLSQDDFPDLSQLNKVQSQTQKQVKGKGKKRKKQKRIDITHELFFNRDDDE